MDNPVCRHLRSILLTAVLAVLASSTAAAPLTLLDAWEQASVHAPAFQAEQAAYQAGLARHQQARSLWLPNVGATATIGRGSHKSTMQGAQFSMPSTASNDVEFNTSVRNGRLYGYEVGVQQPLLDRARLTQSRQLQLASQVSQHQWQHAQQALLLDSAQHYFTVLLARETKTVLKQQLAQVRQVHEETKRRYELGDAPITNTHESTAQLRTLEAQLAEAQQQVTLAEEAFLDFTGVEPKQLLTLDIDKPLEEPALQNMSDWLADAARFNPMLKMQEKGMQVAQEEVASYNAWKSPTLNLVGRAAYEKIDGSGRFGDAMNKSDEWMVGVQLHVPIFTGGYRRHKHTEALHQQAEKVAEKEALQQHITQQTRAAWLAINTSYQQSVALQQAVAANDSRLQATQLGHRLGHNTTLEMLDAENALASTRLQLLETSVALIMHQLELSALVGGLTAEQLAITNAYLQ